MASDWPAKAGVPREARAIEGGDQPAPGVGLAWCEHMHGNMPMVGGLGEKSSFHASNLKAGTGCCEKGHGHCP